MALSGSPVIGSWDDSKYENLTKLSLFLFLNFHICHENNWRDPFLRTREITSHRISANAPYSLDGF
jgi:hypothetical protein